MESIRVGRILLTSITIEVVAIGGLFAVVAIFGPNERVAAEAFAQSTGLWFGPLSGLVLCVAGGYWLACTARISPLLNGFILGAVVAIIDAALLVLSGTSFKLIFLVSNFGKVAAGAVGGWLAGRRGLGAA